MMPQAIFKWVVSTGQEIPAFAGMTVAAVADEGVGATDFEWP